MDSERRRETRHQLLRPGEIIPLIGGCKSAAIAVMLRDLSSGGVGVLCSYPLLRGDCFLLTIANPQAEPRTLLYTVRRMHYVQPDQYLVGAQLVCAVDDVDNLKPIKLASLKATHAA